MDPVNIGQNRCEAKTIRRDRVYYTHQGKYPPRGHFDFNIYAPN